MTFCCFLTCFSSFLREKIFQSCKKSLKRIGNGKFSVKYESPTSTLVPPIVLECSTWCLLCAVNGSGRKSGFSQTFAAQLLLYVGKNFRKNSKSWVRKFRFWWSLRKSDSIKRLLFILFFEICRKVQRETFSSDRNKKSVFPVTIKHVRRKQWLNYNYNSKLN